MLQPERLGALELANLRYKTKAALSGSQVEIVGARAHKPELLEYTVVPFPEASAFLGSSLLNPKT